MRYRIGFAAIILTLFSCSWRPFQNGEILFLKHKGADIPVLVSGNTDSGIFIIHVHGGPGGSGLGDNDSKLWQEIGRNYGNVFWDQRASGAAQGSPSLETYTLEQFTEDMELVVELIRTEYHQPTIFIEAISWGGTLSTSFFLKAENQTDIAGWIYMDGAHNPKLGNELSVQFVKDYGHSILEDPECSPSDRDYWNEALQWYADHPRVTGPNLGIHSAYVAAAYGYVPKGAADTVSDDMKFLFDSPYNLAPFVGVDFFLQNFEDCESMDLTPQMYRITVPALIVWGTEDGILPYPLAEDFYSHIGTAAEHKRIVTLNGTGHYPLPKDFDLLNREISRFIQKYAF